MFFLNFPSLRSDSENLLSKAFILPRENRCSPAIHGMLWHHRHQWYVNSLASHAVVKRNIFLGREGGTKKDFSFCSAEMNLFSLMSSSLEGHARRSKMTLLHYCSASLVYQ